LAALYSLAKGGLTSSQHFKKPPGLLFLSLMRQKKKKQKEIGFNIIDIL